MCEYDCDRACIYRNLSRPPSDLRSYSLSHIITDRTVRTLVCSSDRPYQTLSSRRVGGVGNVKFTPWFFFARYMSKIRTACFSCHFTDLLSVKIGIKRGKGLDCRTRGLLFRNYVSCELVVKDGTVGNTYLQE